MPLDWAMAQNNLGNALSTLGERDGVTARLQEVATAYRSALEVYTRERRPLQWAGTQNNLGAALLTLGKHESGTARLEEAMAAYRAALEEFTYELVPLDWARSYGYQGVAMMRLAERRSDLDMAKSALEQIVVAHETVRDGSHAPLSEHYAARIPEARALIARLQKGTDP